MAFTGWDSWVGMARWVRQNVDGGDLVGVGGDEDVAVEGSTVPVGSAGAKMAMSSRAWVTRRADGWSVDMADVWMLAQMEAVRVIRPMRAMAIWCWSARCGGRASVEAGMAARLATRWATGRGWPVGGSWWVCRP